MEEIDIFLQDSAQQIEMLREKLQHMRAESAIRQEAFDRLEQKPVSYTHLDVYKRQVENAPWIFGEFYAHDIIGNLNAGMSRFLDWNLMLDTQGGPNHVGNYCSAPLICDVRTGRVFPQPSYHAIAHFSRFLPRGSQCIAVSRYTQELEVAAAQTPDGSLIAVVLNSTDKMLPAVFSLLPQSLICKADIPPHSLETWVFHA